MTTTASYKDKRRIQVPKESWVITENTHEPIIQRETWLAVRQMRNKGKKRPNKDGKTLPLHGLIFCADCGSRAYYTNLKSYNCGRYKNSSRHSGIDPCFSHHIMYRTLERHVLADLQELVAFVKNHEAEFIKKVESFANEQMAKTAKDATAEYEKATARIEEIDRTINFLYADRTGGILPAERFAKMLAELEAEQKALVGKVSALKAGIDSQEYAGSKAKQFVSQVRKTTSIKELTHEIAGAFIHKIYLGKPERINGERHQEIEIVYNAIGKIEV